MSKANRANSTSTKSNSSRRSVLTTGLGIAAASVVGSVALSTTPALSASTSEKALAVASDDARLSEARRLIAALIATDREISAAESADDDALVDTLEARHKALRGELRGLAGAVYRTPPANWSDIVVRAEIAGYPLVWDKDRGNWGALLRVAKRNPDAGSFALKELASAILYVDHA